MAYKLKADSAFPTYVLPVLCVLYLKLYHKLCTEPCTQPGSCPTYSTISISPQFGQYHPSSSLKPKRVGSSGIIQNAGHVPQPPGSFILASIRPYVQLALPDECILAEEYSLPLCQSRCASITSAPFSTLAFSHLFGT